MKHPRLGPEMQRAWAYAVWLDEACVLADRLTDLKAQYEQERDAKHLICAGTARVRWLNARDALAAYIEHQPPAPPLLWMGEDLGPYRLCGTTLVMS